ncbi:MAG: hypothetical protein K9K64_16420 [Desulfohalobiaceae bacterium]|nr:hypothetical protein [Desulfohalobiaceae bacterium]
MSLLGVDLGLKTGLALFAGNGRLVWYRSHNYGSAARLKRGIPGLIREIEGLEKIVVEGGGGLAEIWEREARKEDCGFKRISADQWRRLFLLPRKQKSGSEAKRFAEAAARRVILWSNLPKPAALRHDTAEAILTGLWGVLDCGCLESLPRELRPK